jgi:hypothetical protein
MATRKAQQKKTVIAREQTTQEISEVFSVHAKTVRQWVADKCPHSRKKGVIYLNDGEVQHWLTSTGRKTTPGRPAEEKTPIPDDLGGDKDYWLARKYRRQCLEDEGLLVDLQDVRRWIHEHIGTAKKKLLGLGAALSPLMEGRDAAERQAAIDARVEEILNELSAAATDIGPRVEAAGTTSTQ